MPRLQRANAGEQGGRLLIAAGALTLVNDYLPGAEHLDVVVLDIVGVVAVLLGVAALLVPWERLPVRAPLVLALAAFGLIVLSNLYGGVSAFSYAVYFVVIFVWIGIGQPPRTSFWLAPVATAAYIGPFLAQHNPPPNAVASVTVAIPVCVLVGEVLARSVRRLDQSRQQLAARVRVVERLATLTSDLGSDLDVEAVSRRLVDSAAQIFDARAAAFGAVDGLDLVITAAVGMPASYVGLRVPLEGTRLAAVGPGQVVLTPADDIQFLPTLAGGSAVTVGCFGPELLGGLTILLERSPDQVSDEVTDVLRLLAAQGAGALVNAATHRAVVRQREHEQAVVDVLADGVLVLSAGGLITSCNTAAAVMLGSSVEQLVGQRPPIEIAPPGSSVEHEIATGHWVEALSAVLPTTGELVVALRDTSRQRALDEAKDLFLATTSHELRTPLTAIKGYVRTLQRRWAVLSDEARLDALATVDEQTDALVELTNHLLMGARAGTAAHTAAGSPFDLGEVVARAVSTYGRMSERHAVVADVPPVLPLAMGDKVSVENVLAQLVENAVKYSPDGGEVRIVVSDVGGTLAVEVLDRGVGIPAGLEQALFTPFYQAGPANTREFGGVGLGLYIVRQLVEAQGGEVSARNRPGGGAVLRFTVPTVSASVAASRPA
jgi:NtrC-family two-component system sensor histidine kinase KinB